MEVRPFSKYPLLLLTIGVCSALLLPALFMDGMFMDGLLYASVSRNYAEGLGTFWNPTFSETFFVEFHEQPPLMFFLQGLFFLMFGSGIYTERIYCLVAAVLTAWVLMRCWKLLAKENNTNWFALLMWFTSPVIFYAYTNNIEECTMTLFMLLGFQSILKALNAPSGNYFQWILAGFWLLAAGMTKGVQGMFLLSAPFWAWLILRNGTGQEFLKRSIAIATIPVLFVIIALCVPVIRESFDDYFSSRFGKTFSGATANSTHHFHILFEALLDLLPALFVTLFLVLAGRKTSTLGIHWLGKRRLILFVFACGLSGILPLMVTLEQRGFYLATPLPLVLLAIALIAQPVALRITAYLQQRVGLTRAMSALGVVIIAAVIVVTVLKAGEPKRDADKIAGIHEIASITGENLTLRSTDALNGDWSFLTYGQRFHHLSFTEQDLPQLRWLVSKKGAVPEGNYVEVPLRSPVYSLYRRP